MDQLPDPPLVIKGDGIEIRFRQIEPGDSVTGTVSAYHFRIHDADGIDVGRLRYRPSNATTVTHYVGHVGFEIAPEHRGKRYAYRACLAIAPFVFQSQESVILTTNLDNTPSNKTIERLGAVFLDIQTVPETDPHYAFGGRVKRRYRWGRPMDISS